MSVSILVHWRPGDPVRERIWHELRDQLPKTYELVTIDGHDQEPYRGRDLNTAAEEARGDVFIIQDADKFIDPLLYEQAVDVAAKRGVLVYTISRLVYENEDGTEWAWGQPRDPAAITAEAFWKVGGFRDDVRFCEDEIFELACSTLLGHSINLGGEGRHPWHPAADRHDYAAGHAMLERYRAAAGNLAAMKELQGV